MRISQHARSLGHRLAPGSLLVTAALLVGGALSQGLLVDVASAHSHEATVCVNQWGSDGCYNTIQDAVDHAQAGATVKVAPGTYKEDVHITKTLRLEGAGAWDTSINAIGRDNGVVITGTHGGSITGFTIENAKLAGLQLTNVSWLTVADNTVQRNDRNLVYGGFSNSSCPGALPFEQEDCGEGIYLQGVSYSRFSHNLVQNNAGGILVTDETGPTHNNLITGNTVRNNIWDCGITMPSHPTFVNGALGPGYGVYDNTVSHNVSTGNGTAGSGAGTGVFAPTPYTKAYDNKIIDNVLTNNGAGGVVLHSHAPNQNLNGNTIIGNTISGNGPDGDSGTSYNGKAASVGIVIFADASAGAAPIKGTTIRNNTISHETIGVFVGRNDASVQMHWNNLGGTTVGVDNAGTGTVYAQLNYWGCPRGPGHHGCSAVEGNVLYRPWLWFSLRW